MATKKEILGNNVDPVLRYQRLKEEQDAVNQRMKKEQDALTGDIKQKLLKQLMEAAETLTVLMNMGEKEIMKEPAYAEVKTLFEVAIGSDGKTKVSAGRSSANRKPRIDLMVREFLKKNGETKQDDIIKQFPNEGSQNIIHVLAKRSGGARPIFKKNGDKFSAIVK